MKNLKNKLLTGILVGTMAFGISGKVFGQEKDSLRRPKTIEMSYKELNSINVILLPGQGKQDNSKLDSLLSIIQQYNDYSRILIEKNNQIIQETKKLCGLDFPNKKQDTLTLEQYNSQNKQVYDDFGEFMENIPGNSYDKKDVKIFFHPKTKIIHFSNLKKDYVILDAGKKGFDKMDYIKRGENHSLVEDLLPEKQLQIAKEYTNSLKEIMHEAGQGED